MLADPMRMNADFLQRMAARCRDLTNRTQNEAGKEQLRFWAAEFEEQAARADLAEHAESGEPRFGGDTFLSVSSKAASSRTT